jgi:hypothetical protein
VREAEAQQAVVHVLLVGEEHPPEPLPPQAPHHRVQRLGDRQREEPLGDLPG